MENIKWTKIDKEHFQLKINGVEMGTWHQSQMRHLIEETDKAIENYIPNDKERTTSL